MKAKWEVKKLDNVCDVGYGTRVVQKRDGGTIYPVYGGGGATFFMDKPNREDCLIIARFAMSEKCTRFVKGKFFLNDSGLSVIPKDKKELYQEFLNYQILYLNNFIYSLGRGTAQKNLDVPKFREIEIKFPKSMDEQKLIVSILDKSFEKIQKTKENVENNLKNAKELFESYLRKVFLNNNWEKINLGKYNEVVVGYVGPISAEYTNNPEDVLLLSTKNVHFEGLNLDKLTYVNKKFHDANKKSQLSPGDILVSRHGESGQSAVIPTNIKQAHALNVIIIKKSNEISSDYISYLLNSKILDKINSSKKGSVQKIINTSVIKELIMPLPPLLEQQETIDKLRGFSQETKKLEAIYQQKLNDLEELKKAILQKAFNGELIKE